MITIIESRLRSLSKNLSNSGLTYVRPDYLQQTWLLRSLHTILKLFLKSFPGKKFHRSQSF